MNIKFTKVERNAMISMLDMGMTVRKIADALGLEYMQVYNFKHRLAWSKKEHNAADAAAIETSAVAADNKSRFAFRFTDEQKSAMTSMLARGLTNKQVADALGLKSQQVYDFKSSKKKREARLARLAAKRAMEAAPSVSMAEAKPETAADSGNIVQIDLPLAQGERIVRVPIKLKLDISVA